ncbi:MAG TPA: DUF711 family protein [Candidatus Acidoferrales bacterium]|nr:DUF711 family protein [Candidatus Acidoferrales bacterium]
MSPIRSRAARPRLAPFLLPLLAALSLGPASGAGAAAKPQVRAITGFVKIDRANYRQQIQAALKTLDLVREALQKAGYTVQGVRICTQPFPEYVAGLSRDQALAFLRELSALAAKDRFAADIGPAIWTDAGDAGRAELLGEILAGSSVNATIIVAGDDGVHWNAVHAAARVMKYLEAHTPHGQGNFSFAATAEVPDYTPFFPGAHHNGPGRSFSIALESASVVAEAFAGAPPPAVARRRLVQSLGADARSIEQAAERIAAQTGWSYRGIDLSPAPSPNDSIGAALENLTGKPLGSSGTLSAAALLTAALRSLPVKQAGYSGMMLPVLEDARIAQRWSEGRLSLDSLLAYSAVCGTGLDVVPLPGDVSEQQLAAIIGDVASLAVKWRKPLTARLMPVPGKRAGERSEFTGAFLANATIQPLP